MPKRRAHLRDRGSGVLGVRKDRWSWQFSDCLALAFSSPTPWTPITLNGKTRRRAMNKIPLDLQRKCEQRWAAGLMRLAPSGPSQKHRPENETQPPARPAKAGRETGKLKPHG